MTESAPLPKPIVLESQKLGMGTIGCMAVSPDARRIYLGRHNSYQRECLNLGVLSLDADGNPINDSGTRGAKPKLYPDSRDSDDDVNIRVGQPATVGAIIVAPKWGKLYLTVAYESRIKLSAGKEPPHHLTVYDLKDGDPNGKPRSYSAANLSIPGQTTAQFVLGYSLAVRPQGDFLYLVGYSFPHAAVYAYPLKDGEPDTDPSKWKVYYNLGDAPQDTHIYQVAVSEKGDRLYLGTHDNQGSPLLKVLDLDPSSGLPLDSSSQPINETSSGRARTQALVWSPPDPANPNNSPDPKDPNFNNINKLLFHYSPRALYRRHPRFADAVWPLYVWPLDAVTGYPITPSPVRSTSSGRAEAVDSGTAAYTVWSAPGVSSVPAADIVWVAVDDVFTNAFAPEKEVTDGLTPSAVIFTYTVNPTDTVNRTDNPVVARFLGRQGPTHYLQAGVGGLMDVAADNHQVVLVTEPIAVIGNEASEYYLRVSVSGPPPASPNVQLFIAPRGGSFVPFPKDGFSGFSVYLDESHQQWKPTWSTAVSLDGSTEPSRATAVPVVGRRPVLAVAGRPGGPPGAYQGNARQAGGRASSGIGYRRLRHWASGRVFGARLRVSTAWDREGDRAHE
jgi:hypothetical protein